MLGALSEVEREGVAKKSGRMNIENAEKRHALLSCKILHDFAVRWEQAEMHRNETEIQLYDRLSGPSKLRCARRVDVNTKGDALSSRKG